MPSIPSLTPQGYVRWQTVQLLLCPQEHVSFLQQAVKRFEITNDGDGGPFPKILPKEAFPSKPDLQMTHWHDTVTDKLRFEAENAARLPAIMAAERDSARNSPVPSNPDYFMKHHMSHSPLSPGSAHAVKHRHQPRQPMTTSHTYHGTRRRSLPDQDPTLRNDIPTPTSGPTSFPPSQIPRSSLRPSHRRRPRTPSTRSTSSDSETDTLSSDSDSAREPRSRRPPNLHVYPPPPGYHRRHSAHGPSTAREQYAHGQQQEQSGNRVNSPSTSNIPDAYDQRPRTHPGPSSAGQGGPVSAQAGKGMNVRWREFNDVANIPGSTASTPGIMRGGGGGGGDPTRESRAYDTPGSTASTPGLARDPGERSHGIGSGRDSEEMPFAGSGLKRSGTEKVRGRHRSTSPLKGVGGRKYAAHY
ncbi:hypothetical protein MMC09_002574 [Bachmanniomyces sp. S44760]|nr:hypothetical protein [Bachmanniomyces sp. S44760]